MKIVRALINAISLSRIIFGFLFFLFLTMGELLVSFFVFLLGVFSDKLDGVLARWQRIEKNKLGKLIDPLSDRIFISTVFVALYMTPLSVDVSWWAVLLTVGQDVVLAPLGIYSTIKKQKSVTSSLGKVATVYQYSFVVLLLFLNLLHISVNPLIFELFLIILNLISATHHVYLWLLKEKNEAF